MKSRVNRNSRRKRLFLLFFAFCAMATGLFLFSNQLYTYTKGFFLTESYTPEPLTPPSAAASSTKKEPGDDDPLYPVRPAVGDHIGDLYIPALDATLPIYHGTDEDMLEKGVGHFAGSVLPGERDNSVLSGHRDTVFRKLGEVGEGDELIVTTFAGTFTYFVHKVRIVDKDDRTVIVPKPRATLTVSTCYPFNFIGAAPDRYILEGYLVDQELTKDQPKQTVEN
ncbi:class D sortase [Jeotgalibacillus soli]|uniref:Sortase family protein n=1 Tax=Jeotgalibacillus soli TaxID=889306 RepID=A0A0C2W5X6_9BACL|nr:class D sortase [Jeotgalibacillus soli]KIL51981.1 sortase family protein [Jeotgalibacillus soli]